MAYVVETATTSGSGTGAVTIPIGTPLQNDLILIFCGVGGSATISTSGQPAGVITGYTLVYTSTNTVRQYCWYKVAGASETPPTVVPSFSSNSAFVTVIIRDADPVTPITNSSGVGYNTSTFTNVKEVAAPQITTGVAATSNLIIHAGSIVTDSIVADFSKTTALATSSGGGTVFVAKEWVENASTASTAFTWLTNQSASRNGCLGVVAINNKSGGLRDISCSMSHKRLAKPYPYGTNDTLSAPNTVLSTLDSLAVASAASSVYSGGTLNASYLTALNISTNTNFGADTWAGFAWPLPANMSGRVVGFAWNPTQPWSTATTNSNGVAIVFSDNVGAWAAYQVRTLSTAYLNTDHIKYISPGVTTPLGTSGSIDWTNITNITWLYARKASQTNAPIVSIASAYLFDGVSTLYGGSATKPITASQIYKSVTQYIEGTGTVGLPAFGAFQGSGQVLGYAPIQLGNGAVPTYVQLAANSYETPPSSTRLNDYYVTNASYGITLYGSATCTFDLRSALIASTSLQQFTIHASSSLSASMLTTGASFIGRTFADNAGYTWSSVSWSECDTVSIGGGGDLTSCSIIKTISSNAALSITANGSVLTSTTVDCTKSDGTFASYCLELGTPVTSVTLTDVTFSGTPGTNKVHVLKTTGTVTITISGTTALTAGQVTSAGATVVISAPALYQKVVVSGFTAGSRIQIYDTTSSTELFNGTASSGNTVVSGTTATWTDSNPASASRAIRLRVAYCTASTANAFVDQAIGTCGTTSGAETVSVLVNPVVDSVYVNNLVDGTAITDCSIVGTALLLRINAGSTTWQHLYAWMTYWLSTAGGIRDQYLEMIAASQTDYYFNTAHGSFKIRNDTTGPTIPLLITGGNAAPLTGVITDILDTTGGSIFCIEGKVVPFTTSSQAVNQATVQAGIAAELSTIASAVWNKTLP